MLTKELQVSLNLAVREAQRRRHEFLTLEHLLFALLHDPRGEEILEACGGDLPGLRAAVDTWLDEELEPLDGDDDFMPEQTLSFQRVIQRAAFQADRKSVV